MLSDNFPHTKISTHTRNIVIISISSSFITVKPFDVALLKLAERVDLKKFPPVCLPKPTHSFFGVQGHVYGEYKFTSFFSQSISLTQYMQSCPPVCLKKNHDNFKDEDTLKNEDALKNVDVLKNENDLQN